MPRTKVIKEEGGGYRVVIKPNNASEHPTVTAKFPTRELTKAGLQAVRDLWEEKREVRRQRRA